MLVESTAATTANTAPPKSCNCRVPASCPLRGNCLSSSLVYRAEVSCGREEDHVYIGSTSQTFKARFSGHKSDMTHQSKKTSTMLSRHVWSLKASGEEPSVTWSIQKRAFPYQCGSGKCDLCLSEKCEILRMHGPLLLNKRSEIAGKCRHRAKFKLESVT